MPHITTERVKEVRTQLRKQFPQVKFSVVRRDYSSIHITILESPFDFGTTYEQLNTYCLEWYKHSEFLEEVKAIANKGNKIESEDGDYGSIPAFYLNINIGQWNKPYIQI